MPLFRLAEKVPNDGGEEAGQGRETVGIEFFSKAAHGVIVAHQKGIGKL